MRAALAIILALLFSVSWAQNEQAKTPRLLESEDLLVPVDSASLERQYSALLSMKLESVEYSNLGSVRRIAGDTNRAIPPDAESLKVGDSADSILALIGDLLLAKGTESLKVTRHDEKGFNANPSLRTLGLTQEVDGIPVLNSFVGIVYDDSTKEVSKLVATFVPDRELPREPKLSSREAEAWVPAALSSRKEKDGTDSDIEIAEGTHLAYYYNPKDPTPARLVWVVRAQHKNGGFWQYYVNAASGALMDRVPDSMSLTVQVYNANNALINIPNGLPADQLLFTGIPR